MAQARALSLFLLLLLSCTNSPSETKFPNAKDLTLQQTTSLKRSLSEAEIVFVGTLLSVDTEWTGYSGAFAVVKKPLTFKVLRILKGKYPLKKIEVKKVMMKKGTWVEEKEGGGIRLSPRFFKAGVDYIVLSSAWWSPGDYYIHGEDYEGVWINTKENIATISALLEDLPKDDTADPDTVNSR